MGIQFIDGYVNLSQVQLLSHQSKISTRIELYMGTGPEYMKCQFTRLGYLSLDSNERSAFKAREMDATSSSRDSRPRRPPFGRTSCT